MTSFQEKRRAERISTERPISIQYLGNTHTGKMIDISILGVGFLIDTQVNDNETLNLSFSLPHLGQKTLQIKGQVMHTQKVRNQFLVGLEFIAPSAAFQAQIQEFAHYHRPMD